MTFEEEWAELKRETSVRMNLASTGGEGGSSGGGQGNLRSSRQVWHKGAQAVGSLQTNLKAALRELESKHDTAGGAVGGVDGLRSASSHLSAYQSWQRRLDLVSRECEELRDKLQKSGDAFYKSDAEIGEAFREQKSVPMKSAGAARSDQGRRAH
ncbi:hypothetical protein [Streptomyces noursei]|uniref:hypothetical protein n=1 Tax=Streptomyces noursei TaxID=1971 RepID=UPI00167688AA|nr:hypothetical protein [Streptomyces noursei]MCZ1014829.1 hypothetical protein [Streptomyces noursei]GGX48206.1 hypothetical protein GCM10010341_82320 [Streptomyces noursei]